MTIIIYIIHAIWGNLALGAGHRLHGGSLGEEQD